MPIDSSTANAPQSIGCKLDVRTLTTSETFQCQAKDLYDVLTKSELVSVFTRSAAKVDACKGGEFILFDGNITGKFLELIPHEKIVQSWRYKQWPNGHYSNVVLELIQKVT